MDFLAENDEAVKIDYTPLKNLVAHSISLDKSLFSTSLLVKAENFEVENAMRIFGMSKKYQLIQIDWLKDALEPEYDINYVNVGNKK